MLKSASKHQVGKVAENYRYCTNKHIGNNVEKKATQLFLALSKHLRVDVRLARPRGFAKLLITATFQCRS